MWAREWSSRARNLGRRRVLEGTKHDKDNGNLTRHVTWPMSGTAGQQQHRMLYWMNTIPSTKHTGVDCCAHQRQCYAGRQLSQPPPCTFGTQKQTKTSGNFSTVTASSRRSHQLMVMLTRSVQMATAADATSAASPPCLKTRTVSWASCGSVWT